MAHTKAAGTSRLGRDSQPQYLGVKLFSGEKAKPGSIIVRQRGTKFKLGKNVKIGCDDTIYSMINGIVHFKSKSIKRFDGNKREAKVVSVIPAK